MFHHCASVPPGLPGIIIQAAVSPPVGLRRPVVQGLAKDPGKVDGLLSLVVQSDNYWSSTTNANNTDNAWNVNLNNGNVNNNNKTNTNYVWPVRGGEWWSCRPIYIYRAINV